MEFFITIKKEVTMKKQLLVLAIIALFAVPQNGQALELTNSQKSEWEQFIEKAETAEKLKKVNGNSLLRRLKQQKNLKK